MPTQYIKPTNIIYLLFLFFAFTKNLYAQKDPDFILKKTWAELYSQKGNFTQAIQSYAIAVSIDPSCTECKRAIVDLKKKIEKIRKETSYTAPNKPVIIHNLKENNPKQKRDASPNVKLKPIFPDIVLLKYPYTNEDTTLNDFYIGKYEVTQKEWKNYCIINNLKFPEIETKYINDNFPIINITWQEAKNYAQWLNGVSGQMYDLPTKAEWLQAKSKIKNLKNEAWIFENAIKSIHEVGKKTQNTNGVFDLEGNVAEWVDDWSDKDFLKENELKALFNNNDSFKNRVVCGCSFKDESYFCKDTFLRSFDSEIKKEFIGFRLVKRKY